MLCHPWKSFIPTHIIEHRVQKAPHFPNKLLLTFWLSITCGCRGARHHNEIWELITVLEKSLKSPITIQGKLFTNEEKLFTMEGNLFTNEGKLFTRVRRGPSGRVYLKSLIIFRTTSNSRKVTSRRQFLLWSQSINCEMRDSFEVLFWLCRCKRSCQCPVAWCGPFGQAYALQKYQSGQELQWNC